jgi:hypothetical protein
MKRDTQIGTCSVNSSLDVTTTTQADGARARSASLPHTGYAYQPSATPRRFLLSSPDSLQYRDV